MIFHTKELLEVNGFVFLNTRKDIFNHQKNLGFSIPGNVYHLLKLHKYSREFAGFI